MKYKVKREEELKNKVAIDYFKAYDCTKINGNVDFCVCIKQGKKELLEQESLLWAESKSGSSDIYKSIVQLVLTIGKARTFDSFLPPAMLGAFDGEKIAFIPYSKIHDVFYINDFNWNVAPSDHETKEFKLIYEKVKQSINDKALLFFFLKDDKELKSFINSNFIVGKFGLTKTRIDKNNFMVIYNKWLQSVKPTIAVKWDIAQKTGIIDGDFYLADLLSQDNDTLKDKLYVLLKHDHYELDRKLDDMGMFSNKNADFKDKQVAHTQFWNRYDRPPKEEYWDYIVERRDLLVPQDVRERKGSFFTPQIWVELSQKYLTDVLGENWQDEYYVWDCAGGTGNLLNGLTNKYNIWVSTIDMQDVEVMYDRIKNGANLLDEHVFQFDFLNDDFTKLPKSLQDIINNPEKRKKLVVYINPPYAEASSYGTESKSQVANNTYVFNQYKTLVGAESLSDLFSQFFIRIYSEIPNSIIAAFSKPKYITSDKFTKFRVVFMAEYLAGFACKADTFDNVIGKFPISFIIWSLRNKRRIESVSVDVFDTNDYKSCINNVGTKTFIIPPPKTIGDWRSSIYSHGNEPIGYIIVVGPSMQSNNNTFFTNKPAESYINKSMVAQIEISNLKEMAIYFSVRHVVETTWLNDKDVYQYPNDKWKIDLDFQNDCLIFMIFNTYNNVSSNLGTNYWIPFSEQEVNARDRFESNFMSEFISGKLKIENKTDLFGNQGHRDIPLVFSQEATDVFNEARELWKYYHSQQECNVNASLYDIREHFQGRNESGKMNNKSDNEVYMKMIIELREKLRQLAKKIEPKVYEYGFLKK